MLPAFRYVSVVLAKSAIRRIAKHGLTIPNPRSVRTEQANGEVASDDTFEAQSFNMTFRSAASHTFVLRNGQPSTVEARVDRPGAGNTTNSSVRLRCYALALAPGHHGADLV